MNRNRLRYKIFTSFALALLALIATIRLWMVAPPSSSNYLPYVTLLILIAAGLWRGIIFVRAANARTA